MDAANDGDVIEIATGVYTDVNSYAGLTQVVYISKSVTIRGGYTATDWFNSDPLANPTTLDAQERGRVLYITGDIRPAIEGLHLVRGKAPLGGFGGGLSLSGADITIRDNTIANNSAYKGGGMFLGNSTAVLEGNTVISNTAIGDGGGIIVSSSNVELTATLSFPTLLWVMGEDCTFYQAMCG